MIEVFIEATKIGLRWLLYLDISLIFISITSITAYARLHMCIGFMFQFNHEDRIS